MSWDDWDAIERARAEADADRVRRRLVLAPPTPRDAVHRPRHPLPPSSHISDHQSLRDRL